MISITHEPDDFGNPACPVGLHMEGAVSIPGQSTCGLPECRDLRSKRRAKATPVYPKNLPYAYAQRAYAALDHEKCPGGEGHEGRGSGSYCEACITGALAAAWAAGRK